MNLARRSAADLQWVITYWPDLAVSRFPDVTQTWRTFTMSAEVRAERDAQARAERWDRTGDAPGHTPAPVKVAVLDILADVLADAFALVYYVGEAVMAPCIAPPTSGSADARPFLSQAAALLLALDRAEQVATSRMTSAAVQEQWEESTAPEVAPWAYGITRNMVATVARALSLLYDGQELTVECPWCHGVTSDTPAGGAYTWHVRDLLGTRSCEHGHPDRRFCDRCPQLVVIVCEGDACNPPQKKVGTWWRGRPCWPIADWEWLAKQVQRAEAKPR